MFATSAYSSEYDCKIVFGMAPPASSKSKSKKVADSLNRPIQLVMKSGKYVLGFKQTMKTIRNGKAQLVLLSSNTPGLRRSMIEYLAFLTDVGVHHYAGTNVELGAVCGRSFRVGAVAITDPGDSDIFRVIKKD
ncbi:hypothetical protein ACOME3_008116 [Neoechinorhynchus agilis]